MSCFTRLPTCCSNTCFTRLPACFPDRLVLHNSPPVLRTAAPLSASLSTLWINPAFPSDVQSPAKPPLPTGPPSPRQLLRFPGTTVSFECPACCANRLILRGCPPVARIVLFYLLARIDLFHSNVRLLPEQACFPDKPALRGRSPVARMPVSLDCLPVARIPVSPNCLPVSQIGLFYTIAHLFSGRPPRSLPACPHFG